MDSLAFRTAGPEDRSFIVTKWLRSFRLSHGAGLLLLGPWEHGTAMYYDVQRLVIEHILARPEVVTTVAYKPGEAQPFDLYGFVCIERAYPYPKLVDVVHYLFVDEPYRRAGLGRALLDVAGLNPPVIYTHRTADGQKIAHARGYRYDPLCVRIGRDGNPKETR